MIRGKTFKAHDITAIQKELKSQFRVVVKELDPDEEPDGGPDWFYPTVIHRGEETPGKRTFGIWGEEWHIKCPYAGGDVLYAKETWGILYPNYEVCRGEAALNRMDYGDKLIPVYKTDHRYGNDTGKMLWRPSTHLPKWAARIWLEITEVRCERLQDISEEDAIAEGVDWKTCKTYQTIPQIERMINGRGLSTTVDYISGFHRLWDSIAKPQHNWAANPWVFAYVFKRVEKP